MPNKAVRVASVVRADREARAVKAVDAVNDKPSRRARLHATPLGGFTSGRFPERKDSGSAASLHCSFRPGRQCLISRGLRHWRSIGGKTSSSRIRDARLPAVLASI